MEIRIFRDDTCEVQHTKKCKEKVSPAHCLTWNAISNKYRNIYISILETPLPIRNPIQFSLLPQNYMGSSQGLIGLSTQEKCGISEIAN